MAETEQVVNLPRSLPERVPVPTTLTPNEMRALKQATGRSLSELLGGDENDMDLAPDRIQALVWTGLRREGFDPSWDQAGDVLPETAGIVVVDPTKSGP